MACRACEREVQMYRPAPEFRGTSGMFDNIMPGADSAGLATADTAVGLGTVGAALAQGAIAGAVIGGLSAGSMKGAGTGALLAGGLTGAFGGGALLLASSANPSLRAGGAVGLAAGIVAVLWGGSRSYRAISGR